MLPTPEEKLILLVNEIKHKNYKEGLTQAKNLLDKIYFWIDSGATSYDLKVWVSKEIRKLEDKINGLG